MRETGELGTDSASSVSGEVASRLALVPGVEAAGYTNALPMVQMRLTTPIRAQETSAANFEADVYTVSRDYFRAIGIPIVDGRGFSAEDRAAARPAYVINRAFARVYFQTQDPIGKTLALGRSSPPSEVVGVVGNVRHFGIDADPQPIVFLDPEHTPGIVGVAEGGVYFTVRTQSDPTAIIPQIRTIVRNLDSNLAIDNVATMNQVVANSITTPRSYALLLGAFAASAFVLAMIGLYGVQTHFVTQRRQEIGIRVALGARRAQVLSLVLREGVAVSGRSSLSQTRSARRRAAAHRPATASRQTLRDRAALLRPHRRRCARAARPATRHPPCRRAARSPPWYRSCLERFRACRGSRRAFARRREARRNTS